MLLGLGDAYDLTTDLMLRRRAAAATQFAPPAAPPDGAPPAAPPDDSYQYAPPAAPPDYAPPAAPPDQPIMRGTPPPINYAPTQFGPPPLVDYQAGPSFLSDVTTQAQRAAGPVLAPSAVNFGYMVPAPPADRLAALESHRVRNYAIGAGLVVALGLLIWRR